MHTTKEKRGESGRGVFSQIVRLKSFANLLVRRLGQALVLGSIAPMAWALFHAWVEGIDLGTEFATSWMLYLYMWSTAVLALSVFGALGARRERELQILSARLALMSYTDELTGLRNARYFWSRASEAIAAAERSGHALSLLLFDLDHFKRINDTHGHQAGDAVLAAVGRVARQSVRKMDCAARVGGEEFAVLLIGADLERATKIAERIREGIKSSDAVRVDGERLIVSASAGVVTYDARYTPDASSLYRAADDALYRAKRAGRDRVVAKSFAASKRVEESGGATIARLCPKTGRTLTPRVMSA